MIALVFFVLFGLGFAAFATQNTGIVTVHFLTETFTGIPLYVVVLVTFGFGIVFSTVFYMAKSVFSLFTLHKRQNEVEHLQRENTQLLKRIHQLELENTKLEVKNGTTDENDDESL